jgi:hypothetical protein
MSFFRPTPGRQKTSDFLVRRRTTARFKFLIEYSLLIPMSRLWGRDTTKDENRHE